ncbi:hypothetical protein SEA_MODRAGONS_84 [Mycobacterium phage Modragons]|uniref:Uncharacterized protein n=3 Tax=Gracegardnervirinae TaxID=2946632 RepID=B5U4S6_9CAUD|nr:hypothetical protein PBI_CHE9D_93 [Mycobacterium phage Che9d]YP_002241762.1 gp77 [Mycobacterium phage Fruitloop]YP_009209635.1 hypothetical protein PBI_LLAMA_86 [Mycobacterium phage Llama]YP_010101099.1 hypothetical protein KNU45_gp085 [Mycobacterium phage Ochi17]QFP96466.1 hypothetical protein SEA_MODRAGONS_84 [Mycobacterium phage Modragons]QOP67170.1 hypothetical protein SEA_SEABASTIAN_87 [Mycobacterium phage Seabastian]QOP67281.1 hypothetical protein SEA_OFULTRON_87 [Mycobacterium phage
MSRVLSRHVKALRTAVKFYRMSLVAQRRREEWRAKHGEASWITTTGEEA